MADLRFTVDSALLSELGERLVEHVHIALAELIKNAYDADATNVDVVLLGCAKDDTECIIQIDDNGVGMTFEEVQNYWMRIATTNKVKNERSPLYGRPRTGAKGIGRFSCRRLGTKLQLETTARKGQRCEKTTVEFNWSDYIAGSDVTDITCKGTHRQQDAGECGTKLVIYGGRAGEWNKRSWNVVKRQMMTLIANRGAKRTNYKEDPGFEIRLIAPDFEEEAITNPREQLMNAGWGRLDMKIDKHGGVVYTLNAKKIGEKQIRQTELYPGLAGTVASIAIVPEKREQFRNTEVLSLKNLNEVIANWGGVHVKYKGARVYPFGERGNDWLNIDRDRARRLGKTEYNILAGFARRLKGVDPGRALLNMLSSHGHIGEVEIRSPDRELFQLKANREGFVGDEGVNRLREVIRFGIDWATIYRDYYVRIVSKEKAEHAREAFERAVETPVQTGRDVETAVEYIRRELPQIASSLPRGDRQKIQVVAKASDVILARDRSNREELRHLRLIASASSLMLVFAHEVKALLGILDLYAMDIEGLTAQFKGKSARQLNNIQVDLRQTKDRLIELLKMTSLIAIDSGKSQPVSLALRNKTEKAINCYKLILTNYEINVDCSDIPNALKTGKMLEAELYGILLNALSNAIKSVIARGGEKKIKVTAKRDSESLVIHVLDTGMGVEPEDGEELFVPFAADPRGTLYVALEKRLNPEDLYMVGTGSGLGLGIVRETVSAHGGQVRFCKAKGTWKADLEIRLP